MQTENTAKKGNLTLILCAIIAIMLVLFWFQNCSGKGNVTVIDTKEVKGGFPTVQAKDIEVKEIPSPEPFVVKSATTRDIEDFKKKYGITQKKLDSLLVVNRTLDSLANSLYDKRLQPVLDACKFVEFKHELDNDTIHITLSGLSRGVPQNLDLQYLIKSRKDTIPTKELFCRVFLGAEVGINKELNQGTYKLNLIIQNAKNDLIQASYQKILGQNFYLVGYNKSLFSINKKAKK